MKPMNFDDPVLNRSGDVESLEEFADGNNEIMADDFIPDKTYQPGEYVIYGGALWKCKVTCVGVIPTEGMHWTKTTIGGSLSSLNDEIAKKTYPSHTFEDDTLTVRYRLKKSLNVYVISGSITPKISVGDGNTFSLVLSDLEISPSERVVLSNQLTVSASDRNTSAVTFLNPDKTLNIWGKLTANRGGDFRGTFIV